MQTAARRRCGEHAHRRAADAARLDLVVRDVREATDEEISAGSVGQPVFSVLGNGDPQLH